jgi:hypothetical protein
MAEKDDLKSTLKDKIKNFITDTATLDVITLTGNIELVTDTETSTDSSKEIFNWDKIFEKIVKEMKAAQNSKVSIVAYTHAEWDQDSVNYVAKDADAKLVEAHGKSVASAHESRMNAIKSVVEAVEKLF